MLGGGPCGAIAGAIFRSLYATKEVAVLERNPARREIAQKFYADVTYASSDELDGSDDDGFDYVFDALPPQVNIDPDRCPRRAAMRAARPGSRYVLYGASQTLQHFDTWLLLAKGITLSAAAFDVDHFPMHKTAYVMKTAKALVEKGIVDPTWLITNKISFGETSKIISLFEQYHLTEHLKTVITFDG